MPRKYHTDPESMGLHRLGHAELARNGQRCGTCERAERSGLSHGTGIICLQAAGFPAIKAEWAACTHYQARSHDDHAARLYRTEVTNAR